MAKPAPEVIRLSPAQLDELVAQLRARLPAAVFEVVHAALRTRQWVLEAMELKTTTSHFGANSVAFAGYALSSRCDAWRDFFLLLLLLLLLLLDFA